MRFFNYFPTRLYNEFNNSDFSISDISDGVITTIQKEVRNPITFIYEMQQGERPNVMSSRLYGTDDHEWVIYAINGIIDPYNDWYKTDRELRQYTEKKYPREDVYVDIMYYINSSDKKQVSIKAMIDAYGAYTDDVALAAGLTPITFYEHEQLENEKKRNIYMVKKEYIDLVVNALKEAFGYDKPTNT